MHETIKMNLIDQQCFEDFTMGKSEAITKIMGALERITMETTISSRSANDNNNWIVMTGSENNNNDDNKSKRSIIPTAATTSTTNTCKPRPETPIGKSKSAIKVATTSSKDEGNSSCKEDSSKGSSKQSNAVGGHEYGGALMDYKLTKMINKLSTIDLGVCDLGAEFKSLSMLMERQEKMQRIAFAIEHCEFGSFEYYNGLTFCHHQSHRLVKSILFAFRMDDGYELPTQCTVAEFRGDQAEEKTVADGERLFHESLLAQIHALTGIEPRIERIEGNDIIWYS